MIGQLINRRIEVTNLLRSHMQGKGIATHCPVQPCYPGMQEQTQPCYPMFLVALEPLLLVLPGHRTVFESHYRFQPHLVLLVEVLLEWPLYQKMQMEQQQSGSAKRVRAPIFTPTDSIRNRRDSKDVSSNQRNESDIESILQ